jgi:transposase
MLGDKIMLYLGIDIDKKTHVAALQNADGKIIFKNFSFKNTAEGGSSLLKKLELYQSETIEVGLEATGHYWLSLYSFLHDNGFKIHVINPILTDAFRESTEIRKRKTDKIDSKLIADLIRVGDFREMELPEENIFSLKELTRCRSYFVDLAGDIKRKVICVLDKVFPEYQDVFSNIFGVTSKEILLNFGTPADFEEISSEQLAETLANCSRKRFGIEKAEEIKSLAANTFGVTFCRDSFSFELRLLIENIKFVESKVEEIESEIEKVMTAVNSPITTIPGIGKVIGAVILGELGDVNKFESGAKIVAFAGIDATVKQSGNSVSQNNRMSKRGSPHLRRALYQAALVAATGRKPDPILSAFYQKKISEGKKHKVAIGAVSRKLCYIIFTILKENRPYEIRQTSNAY